MKYTEVGHKIREYRQKKGLTQQQLADSIGVTWEMVSRYERGDSSPMNRIDGLAKALNVSPFELLHEYYKSSGNKMSDGMINNIPLFTKIPKGFEFSLENTTLFYNAPIWITQRDNESFAIESSLVSSKTTKITENSILYISPNRKEKGDSVVLFRKGNNLLCDSANKADGDILGTVVAQETRL